MYSGGTSTVETLLHPNKNKSLKHTLNKTTAIVSNLTLSDALIIRDIKDEIQKQARK